MLITIGMESLMGHEVIGGADIKAIGISCLYLDLNQIIWMLIFLIVLMIIGLIVDMTTSQTGMQLQTDRKKHAMLQVISLAAVGAAVLPL